MKITNNIVAASCPAIKRFIEIAKVEIEGVIPDLLDAHEHDEFGYSNGDSDTDLNDAVYDYTCGWVEDNYRSLPHETKTHIAKAVAQWYFPIEEKENDGEDEC